jgi:hypothetical protein
MVEQMDQREQVDQGDDRHACDHDRGDEPEDEAARMQQEREAVGEEHVDG